MDKVGNKSLWPDFKFDDIKTPLAILQEQANDLGVQTKNILIGEIITTEAYDEPAHQMVLIYQFYIKAPILSNYRYLLFRILQRSSLYPFEIYFEHETPEQVIIDTESQFMEKLKAIFYNPKTDEIIKNLYAQSMQMKNTVD